MLAKIIRERNVGRQTELVELLRQSGHVATQSSVSRDLRELGVAKRGDRYVLPDEPAPSRNDALLWKIRTYLAKDQYVEAAALMEVLAHDPQFPARLQPSLQEVRALYFYKQQVYDSAAIYLEKALPAAGTREEMARWE